MCYKNTGLVWTVRHHSVLQEHSTGMDGQTPLCATRTQDWYGRSDTIVCYKNTGLVWTVRHHSVLQEHRTGMDGQTPLCATRTHDWYGRSDTIACKQSLSAPTSIERLYFTLSAKKKKDSSKKERVGFLWQAYRFHILCQRCTWVIYPRDEHLA